MNLTASETPPLSTLTVSLLIQLDLGTKQIGKELVFASNTECFLASIGIAYAFIRALCKCCADGHFLNRLFESISCI